MVLNESDRPTSVESGSPELKETILSRIATRVTAWTEKWFPDAYAIALAALVIVCAAALVIGASPTSTVRAMGDGYWNLIQFAYQMAMLVITGFALAVCRPARRGINRLAQIPRTGPGAVTFVVFVSILGGLLNWGFGMIFGTFVVMALARRPELNMDFRAAAAAALIGTSSTSMLGLSSSAALLHATPASVPDKLLELSGEIPLTDTVFLWQNGITILVVLAVALGVAWGTHPRGAQIRTAEDMGVDPSKLGIEEDSSAISGPKRPGDWPSENPLLTIVIGSLSVAWIVLHIFDTGFIATISSLNNYIFICLTLALLLHWRVRRFLKAMYDAVPAIAGVLIQFPIYAAVASVIVNATNDRGYSVATYLADFFVAVGGQHTLPLVVGVYSIVMGLFVPSAGAKWVLEAPYILQAGNETESHLGWLINVYSGNEALANLLNPFWMLPVLGLLMLKARNVVGFTFMYFVFLTPVMLFCTWILSYTMQWHPPVLP
ncbi:TIGR00366 family protein [Rhodococcus koreensis]